MDADIVLDPTKMAARYWLSKNIWKYKSELNNFTEDMVLYVHCFHGPWKILLFE